MERHLRPLRMRTGLPAARRRDTTGIGFVRQTEYGNAHSSGPAAELPRALYNVQKGFCLQEIAARDEAGTLERIRECKSEGCGKWYEAGRRDQSFCSKACRRHEFNTSPMQRAKKADYERRKYDRLFPETLPQRNGKRLRRREKALQALQEPE